MTLSQKDNPGAVLQGLPIQAGERYRHYKGGEYEVVTLAIQEDTLEPLVVYKNVNDGKTHWVRTYKNWTESVQFNGQTKTRFVRIE